MQDFKKLKVWDRAQTFAAALYGATMTLRGRDVVSLRSQLRRAAESIAANIAEGANAAGPRDFARYLQMAIASASETESHLDLALRTAVMPAETIMPFIDEVIEVRKMLIVLRRRVLEGGA
jgi:four helix bundle protein